MRRHTRPMQEHSWPHLSDLRQPPQDRAALADSSIIRNEHMEPSKAVVPRIARRFEGYLLSLDPTVLVRFPVGRLRYEHPLYAPMSTLLCALHFPPPTRHEGDGSPYQGFPPQNRRSSFLLSSTHMSWLPRPQHIWSFIFHNMPITC